MPIIVVYHFVQRSAIQWVRKPFRLGGVPAELKGSPVPRLGPNREAHSSNTHISEEREGKVRKPYIMM